MTTCTPAERPARHDPHRFGRWQHGRVAWFNTEHGFGFLDPDDGGESVFVRHTAIAAPGYRTLHPGQPVVFTTAATDRGPEATQVLTYPGTTPAPVPPPRHARPATPAHTAPGGIRHRLRRAFGRTDARRSARETTMARSARD
ncbi:cold-shock protein [Nocardia sp. NPDC057353]|uniref:cold-shock protein n=1 Tax=Nocardia sp. NPDC057353 TaxID=3346104 RepID=UPI00363475C5